MPWDDHPAEWVALARGLREYIAHYHAERNDQGLANMRIDLPDDRATGNVVRSKRIGGILNYYLSSGCVNALIDGWHTTRVISLEAVAAQQV